MRLSAKAQYACIAVAELAQHYGDSQPLQVKSIAERHGISQRFLVQILLQLKLHDLVESTRGAGGGYHLTRDPQQIRLSDIIRAIDHAPSPQSSALSGLSATPEVQAVSSVLQEVQRKQQTILDSVTLADLLGRMEPANGSYQI